jgi:solute carrier family 25 (mitochondrial carnitine/acylcarnitine transporter), member 20/29
MSMTGAASFTIYTRTKEFFRDHHLIDHSQLLGCATVGGIGGAMAGSLISFGSARGSLSVLTLMYGFLIAGDYW